MLNMTQTCVCLKSDYLHLTAESIFFSRIDHVLDNKTNVNKFKESEIILIFFCDHNGINLEIDSKEN